MWFQRLSSRQTLANKHFLFLRYPVFVVVKGTLRYGANVGKLHASAGSLVLIRPSIGGFDRTTSARHFRNLASIGLRTFVHSLFFKGIDFTTKNISVYGVPLRF